MGVYGSLPINSYYQAPSVKVSCISERGCKPGYKIFYLSEPAKIMHRGLGFVLMNIFNFDHMVSSPPHTLKIGENDIASEIENEHLNLCVCGCVHMCMWVEHESA